MIGTYESGSSPAIEIRVFGSALSSYQAISAVVDTGFVGFLLLPSSIGLRLGYVPHTTMEVMLADGSTHNRLVCFGTITFEGQSVLGPVILEDHGTEALVGMEFLQLFRLILSLDAAALTITLTPSIA